MGILLGVASLAMYQSAYAATLQQPGYPGSVALPSIPNGPGLGCTPTHTSHYTWVNGFDPLSDVTFTVNDRPAGSTQVLSNGSVLVLLSFGDGTVEVNGNPPVPTHVGFNVLVVKGHRTTSTGVQVVGVRFKFQVPHGQARSCVTTPVTTSTTRPIGPTTSSTAVTSTTLHRPRFPRFTTSTSFMPTTLAKAIESPLQISPNKVILESSLLAAVLAAVLSAGALGSIWAAGERAAVAGAATASAATAAAADGDEPGGPDEPGPGEGSGPGDGGTPTAPPPPAAPSAPGGAGAPTGAPATTRMTSAFMRRARPLPSGGGGT